MEEPILNAHNKEEYPPMHTAEHILNVTIEFMPREQAADIVDLSKLPEDASETLRIVRVGDYDACATTTKMAGGESDGKYSKPKTNTRPGCFFFSTCLWERMTFIKTR